MLDSSFFLSDVFLMSVKILVVLGVIFTIVPLMLVVERRGSAFMQNRMGPNRIGPFGLIQPIADALKFLLKEDRIPGHVNKFYYVLAPIIATVPALMTFAVVPFAGPIFVDGKEIIFKIANIDVGLIYIFAIASLGIYGIILGGWASNSKYALLGSLRSASQMISYELSMGLSVIGLIMLSSSLRLGDIVEMSGQSFHLFGLEYLSLPKWGIFLQPIGFLVFIVSAFAETNRLPFDLPEGESEIIAGYHLEFGSMKFALFMMSEYINMTTASALIATLYFGGYQLPGLELLVNASGLTGLSMEWFRVFCQFVVFWFKVGFFLWFFVWVRWTIPRFRYDQLMDLGWKVMLPLALINIFLTGLGIAFWEVN